MKGVIILLTTLAFICFVFHRIDKFNKNYNIKKKFISSILITKNK